MVSVIIPAYNAEEYIKRAICSVLNQTYTNYEIIVVNDGSTDLTREIIEEIAKNDNRVRVINTENGGVSRARNIGIEAAKGEFISFLDADDELFPDALEMMRNCLLNTKADICTTWCVRGNTAKVISSGDVEIWDSNLALIKILEDHPATYAVWAKLYRAEKVVRIKFPEGKRVHEDSFFIFLCILSGMKVAVWNYVTYRYHVTQNSASRGEFSEKVFDMLDLAEEKAKIIIEKHPGYADKVCNLRIKAHMALLRNLVKAKGKKYHEAEKESLKFVKRNKAYFVPATEQDRRWFEIITHHLYTVYKIMYIIKRKNKNERKKQWFQMRSK